MEFRQRCVRVSGGVNLAREKYGDLIEYVTYRTGASRNRVWIVLKQYSEVLKDAIRRGYTVQIEGLVEITFTTTEGYIYKNSVYGIDDQVEEISEYLELDKFEVRNIVLTYLKRMYDRLHDGYQVNVKGICYLIPTEEDGDVVCTTRISPVLEKPEMADFLLTTENGLIFKELTGEDLRFKVEAQEDIEYLYSVAKEEEKTLVLRKIDI